MFTLYCDDSGTHAQSEVAVAGCLIADLKQWDKFKDNWDQANEQEKFDVFHMADFVAKQEQFKEPEWQDEKKRDRTIKRLINIIQTRAQFGIACAVVRSAYDEVVTPDLRKRYDKLFGKNHYTFVVRHCIAHIEKWRLKHNHVEPIQYVFDRLSKGRGEIDAQMEVAVSGREDAIRRYGIYKDGWSFQDKAVVIQLQGADIWAYENYKYAAETYFADAAKRKPARASYRALRQRIPNVVRYHNKASLTELVRRLECDV